MWNAPEHLRENKLAGMHPASPGNRLLPSNREHPLRDASLLPTMMLRYTSRRLIGQHWVFFSFHRLGLFDLSSAKALKHIVRPLLPFLSAHSTSL
jgi:hypothetical protein